MSEESTNIDGERRAKSARIALGLTIGGLIINAIGATTFWIALPEKMKQTTAAVADHELRVRALEVRSSEQSSTMGRIDERTKSIQESIADLKVNLRDIKHP